VEHVYTLIARLTENPEEFHDNEQTLVKDVLIAVGQARRAGNFEQINTLHAQLLKLLPLVFRETEQLADLLEYVDHASEPDEDENFLKEYRLGFKI